MKTKSSSIAYKYTASKLTREWNILKKKKDKRHSRLLRKSNMIDALLYFLGNMNSIIKKLHLFNDQFKMILETHEEYHQIFKYQVRQEEDEV